MAPQHVTTVTLEPAQRYVRCEVLLLICNSQELLEGENAYSYDFNDGLPVSLDAWTYSIIAICPNDFPHIEHSRDFNDWWY